MAMIRKDENRKKDLGKEKAGFKHYKVMVKILHDEQIEYQNLEIFTTGLPQLLEMRRVHNKVFVQLEYKAVLDNVRNN
jgi:hypothetical protein